MIQSANESVDFVGAINALSQDDPFACRIISLFSCYPPQLVFVDYWLIRDDESDEVTEFYFVSDRGSRPGGDLVFYARSGCVRRDLQRRV